MSRPTVKQAIEAIKKAKGFVSTAASLCGTSRTTFHAMMNKHPALKVAVEDARELNKDFVENKLMSSINDGNVTAIIFYLKTQAKDRGYIERQENVTFDISRANDEQLRRIANGEHPATVMADTSGG